MLELGLLLLAALFAGLIQGLSGFGAALVALPLLSFCFPIKVAVPVIVLIGISINTGLLFLTRRHFDAAKALPIVLSALPGIPIGIWALQSIPESALKYTIGIVLILFSIFQLRGLAPQRELGRQWAVVAGFVSGIFGGAISANGPPVIVYCALQPWSRNTVRSLNAFVFLCNGVIIAASFLVSGILTAETTLLAGKALPALLIGIGIGNMMSSRLSDTAFKRTVNYLLLVLGIAMVFKTISW